MDPVPDPYPYVITLPEFAATRDRAVELYADHPGDTRPVVILCDAVIAAAPGFVDELVRQAMIRNAERIEFYAPLRRHARHAAMSAERRGAEITIDTIRPDAVDE